jgi:predicted PurR-regulated permease PerM
MFENKITFDSFIRFIFGLSLVTGILVLVNYLSGVLLPFFIACLIAYLIYPLVKFFQYRLRIRSRALSILCALLSLTVAGTALFYLLIPPMLAEFSKVKDLLYLYFTNGADAATVPESLSEFIQKNMDVHTLNEVLNYENVSKIFNELAPRFWNLLSGSINILFSIFASFIILLYIVFILLDYEAISNGWSRMIPVKYRTFAENLLTDVEMGMNKYFRGQALVAFCVGVLFCIGFLIIDFPLAIGLGIFIGILNLVPYLQIVAIAPTILLAILKAADTGENFWIILLSAVAVFVIVQIIQDGFIVPKIMGKITGLNPAIILLSLSVWGSLMGFVGLIIALPLTTLIISYYERFILGHEKITSEASHRTDYQETEGEEEK